ncbi:YCF48-related protein [Pseudomonas sp. OIL-1]|uniref:WD40/YVTN/BNR-like repeat-containing protein n=1 Tax=Pseudomonas sp. OIL-1 TaxID=2706126 RepID=UPI001C49AD8A|nr:YCF48-related protein [Pseudomonas sp. OIL-1]
MMSRELLSMLSSGLERPATRASAFSLCSLQKTGVAVWLRCCLLLAIFLMSLSSFAFESPLSTPAIKSVKATKSPLTAVTKAGDGRLVAVGQRGHILVSDDSGVSWTQANVPVSSDLVAVSFASAERGWAVGHGGVVLKTEDGGMNWILQLDGHQASKLVLDYYSRQAEADPDAEMFVAREELLIEFGGTQSLMDVYFESDQVGYVVGIFNRLLKTVDGGNTWQPWAHRIDNPYELHFYSINSGKDGLYITGEQGMVWRLDEGQQQFVSVETPYDGTLFGAAIGTNELIVFGMRGSAFKSTDQGESWTRLEITSEAGITDGVIFGNGGVALVNLAGELLVSRDGGDSFAPQAIIESMPFYGLAQISSNHLALVGAEGVQNLAVMAQDSSPGESSVSLLESDDLAMNLELRHVTQ